MAASVLPESTAARHIIAATEENVKLKRAPPGTPAATPAQALKRRKKATAAGAAATPAPTPAATPAATPAGAPLAAAAISPFNPSAAAAASAAPGAAGGPGWSPAPESVLAPPWSAAVAPGEPLSAATVEPAAAEPAAAEPAAAEPASASLAAPPPATGPPASIPGVFFEDAFLSANFPGAAAPPSGGGRSVQISRPSQAAVGAASATAALAAPAVSAGCAFSQIDSLQSHGINVADLTKLKAAGFCTVLSIIQATKRELCGVKGVSEAKAEKVMEAAQRAEGGASAFISASQLLRRRAEVLHISTGSAALDLMLQGGLESRAITEVFGEARTGKTQLCHTAAVTAQLPREIGGGNGKVCFIDTEGSFRPEKIEPIARRFGLEAESVLDNILYSRAFTHEHMTQLLASAVARMVEERFSLLVVDSIMALFRVDFSGRGELAERQQLLGRFLSRLMKIAEQFNLAVFITNHVMSDPAGGLTFVANPSKPVGGHVLGHASTTRLALRKGRGPQRICKVYDSPFLPEAEAVFELADGGVVDAADA